MTKTIRGFAESSFIERKSEFIGQIAPLNDEQAALAFIADTKARHRKARHHCFAYIITNEGVIRHSDDGEPSGTAGLPILEAMKREGLSNVCLVVTRYFGGVLLGTGGLSRAYGRAAADVIAAAEIKTFFTAARLAVKLPYSLYGKAAATAATCGAVLTDEVFGEDVSFTVYVKTENEQEFTSSLNEQSGGRADITRVEETEYEFI
ncbi:MAG: YigZ family protein [Oscillospiraceae bacterium]|jgi:uncharacterized YigZ family protein|nr:YigZ family protein [Oscillospiraceae bacterium]